MAIETVPLHVCNLMSATDGSVAIILGEGDGDEKEVGRHFFMCIGSLEARAILLPLRKQTTPRPMTHDFIMSILMGFNAKLTRAVIVDLIDNTFIGRATIRSNAKNPATNEFDVLSIDCRPSDLIAMALRSGVTVEIACGVLDAVAKKSLEELLASFTTPTKGAPGSSEDNEETEDPEDEGWKKGIPPA